MQPPGRQWWGTSSARCRSARRRGTRRFRPLARGMVRHKTAGRAGRRSSSNKVSSRSRRGIISRVRAGGRLRPASMGRAALVVALVARIGRMGIPLVLVGTAGMGIRSRRSRRRVRPGMDMLGTRRERALLLGLYWDYKGGFPVVLARRSLLSSLSPLFATPNADYPDGKDGNRIPTAWEEWKQKEGQRKYGTTAPATHTENGGCVIWRYIWDDFSGSAWF